MWKSWASKRKNTSGMAEVLLTDLENLRGWDRGLLPRHRQVGCLFDRGPQLHGRGVNLTETPTGLPWQRQKGMCHTCWCLLWGGE